VKNSREIMEILEAYDLTGSYRAAAELAGCDHHTVARYVQMRAAGQSPVERQHRARPIDEYLAKISCGPKPANGAIHEGSDAVITPPTPRSPHRPIAVTGQVLTSPHNGWAGTVCPSAVTIGASPTPLLRRSPASSWKSCGENEVHDEVLTHAAARNGR
jgi:hypothetical protein